MSLTCLAVEIGAQSPYVAASLRPNMIFSRYEMDLNRYETVKKFNKTAF